MQLLTDWDGFLAEMQNRNPNGATIYLSRDGRYTVLTHLDPTDQILFRCEHAIPLEEATSALATLGHTCRTGVWSTETEHQSLDELYIAAIAYKSDETQPGLWIDAYDYPPNPSEVLSKLLEEFNAEGTLDHADNETFTKLAKPNIIILSPEDIQNFLAQNQSHHQIEPNEQA